MEETPKKKMSKGCMVGLIVAGIVVLIVIAAATFVYFYRNDIAKVGVITVVNQVKVKLSSEPVEGVDTVRFNTLVDSFLVRFNNDTLRAEAIRDLLPPLQTATGSDRTEQDISEVEQALINYYPDLAGFYQSMGLSPDSSALTPEDSATSSE